MVDDLDLVHTGAEARERVDEPLQTVVGFDDLLRRPLRERVRLVVEHERPPLLDVEDVEAAVQEDAVVHERERPLGARAREPRDPPRQLGAAVGLDERTDPRQLVVGDRGIPRPHLLQLRRSRRGQVDDLQQAVHRVADLGRDQTGLPGDGSVRPRLTHPGDALGVVAVRAAFEERERAVGKTAHVVQRRLRQRLDRRQRRCERRQLRLRPGGEERQLPGRLVDDGRHGLLDRRRRLGGRRRPVDPHEHARAFPLELERRLIGRRELVGAVEPAEHPADRRLLVGLPLAVDRSGDDQAVDRPRHRDVVEPEPLRLVLRCPGVLDALVAEDAVPSPGRGVGDAEAEASVGEAEDLVGRGRVAIAAGIRDDDDLELEALGGVDRQQPHRIRTLLLRHGVALGCTDSLLLLDEADEALDVGTAQLLVRAREPRQLAKIRVAAAAVPLGEHREVVVVVGHDPLAEPLEREPRRRLREPVVALLERAQKPRVVRVEIGRQRPLEPGEDRPARRPPDQQQGVVGDADERRRQHAHERLVVVAVLEQAQVREQVDDLLLAEVAAPGGAVGRKSGGPQLLLVPLGVSAGCEEKDDLARARDAALDQLLHPPRDVPRLRPAPVRPGSRRTPPCR